MQAVLPGASAIARRVNLQAGRRAARRAALSGALLAASLLALLPAAGCDPGPNEVEVGPRLPIATAYDEGSWEAIPVLSCGRYQDCLAAWSPDDGVVGGTNGMILRWRGEERWNHDLPCRYDVVSLAVQPPDVIYALTQYGEIYRCDGADWALDRDNDSGWGLVKLWCDPDGRVTVIGHHGRVLQRVGGVWSDVDLGVAEWLHDIWGSETGELWIVGDGGVVVHQVDGVWDVSHPFGTGESLRDVWGDTMGNVIVLGDDPESTELERTRLHLRLADGWQSLPVPETLVNGVVLVAGQPLIFATEGALTWTGSAWVPAEADPMRHWHLWEPIVLQGAVLGLGNSECVRWSAGLGEALFEDLGWAIDVATVAGDTLVVTSEGLVLCKAGRGWRRDLALDPDYYYRREGFLKGPGGALSLLQGDRLWSRSDGAWTSQTLPFDFSRAFALDDGSLCLVYGDGLWLWDAGGLRSVGALSVAGDGCSPVAAAGPSAREFWFLADNDRLGYCDGTLLREAGPAPSTDLRALAWDSRQGLLLYGLSGIYVLANDGAQQITPRRDWAPAEDRYWVSDLLVLPGGDWLVWAAPGMLYRRGEGGWDCPRGAGFAAVEARQDSRGPYYSDWMGTPNLAAESAGAVTYAAYDALLVFRERADVSAGTFSATGGGR